MLILLMLQPKSTYFDNDIDSELGITKQKKERKKKQTKDQSICRGLKFRWHDWSAKTYRKCLRLYVLGLYSSMEMRKQLMFIDTQRTESQNRSSVSTKLGAFKVSKFPEKSKKN